MAYGTTRQEAASAVTRLTVTHPNNMYQVAPYEWPKEHITGDNMTPLKWGVIEYVPYCDVMPWRNNGFMWIF